MGRDRGGVFGGMEVLQCYNPHKTGGFCTIRVLQGCYKVLQGATDGRIATQVCARNRLRARSIAGGMRQIDIGDGVESFCGSARGVVEHQLIGILPGA